jgi:hypothetical protein
MRLRGWALTGWIGVALVAMSRRGWDATHAIAVAAFTAAPLVRAAAYLKTRRKTHATA